MKVLIPAALLLLTTLPVSAAPMRGPTMKQCEMGYKSSYMRSMKWSRSAFRNACNDKMMMMKKRKMMMMKKDRM